MAQSAVPSRGLPRRSFCAALFAGVFGWCSRSSAQAAPPVVGRPRGRPHVRIDRITLPRELANRDEYLRFLKKFLKREVRRVDWGASSRNKISMRFDVERLDLEAHASVLKVRCTAVGELPHHRNARTELVFGGDRANEQRLVKQVLEIVARGVVSRLSALERARRGLG